MQFIFEDTNDTRENYRFAGRLTIKAENIAESAQLVDHFKLHKGKDIESLQARIVALQSPDLSETMGTEKRPMYEVESCLDYEFSKPYSEWMEKTLGYTGPLPDLDIPRKWDGLQYTHYKAYLRLEGEHICFKAFTSSEPWNKKDAQAYAESSVLDYIGEEFGKRYREPEMIEYRSGQYKRNPDYLRRHKSTPSASNAALKRALFQWWLDTQANAAQRAVVDGNAQIVAETGSYMSAFEFERYESSIYHGRTKGDDGKTRDYKSMSFADFARLGAEVAA